MVRGITWDMTGVNGTKEDNRKRVEAHVRLPNHLMRELKRRAEEGNRPLNRQIVMELERSLALSEP